MCVYKMKRVTNYINKASNYQLAFCKTRSRLGNILIYIYIFNKFKGFGDGD